MDSFLINKGNKNVHQGTLAIDIWESPLKTSQVDLTQPNSQFSAFQIEYTLHEGPVL